MTTAEQNLAQLADQLDRLLIRTPGARHALVLSRDGLKLCHSSGLSADQGDQLAAIACGIQSLAHGASVEFGDGSGGVRQSMTEFHGGILFIVAAGEGAHLAVIGEEYADAGVIGHAMSELVPLIGRRLRIVPRQYTGARDPEFSDRELSDQEFSDQEFSDREVADRDVADRELSVPGGPGGPGARGGSTA